MMVSRSADTLRQIENIEKEIRISFTRNSPLIPKRFCPDRSRFEGFRLSRRKKSRSGAKGIIKYSPRGTRLKSKKDITCLGEKRKTLGKLTCTPCFALVYIAKEERSE